MKKVYLSAEAHPAMTKYLSNLGYHIEFVSYEGLTYYPVSTHPDIFMCRLGVWENAVVFPGNPSKLKSSYPGNIIYNAVCTNKYFIHNMKYTDHELLNAALSCKGAPRASAKESSKRQGKSGSAEEHLKNQSALSGDLTVVDVPQGYTRCCTLPVDDTSFITSDKGISDALLHAGANVLTIEKGHILLPGFNYGFIGGCAGHIMTSSGDETGNENDVPTIIFNGDLSSHPDYKKITAFITERGINIAFFKDYPLTDIGSIIAE